MAENTDDRYGRETMRRLSIALGKDATKLTDEEIRAAIVEKHIPPQMQVSPGVIRKRRMRRAGIA